MKVALIGASGRAGSRILAELVQRGHTVTAIARQPDKIAALAGVTATAGDTDDPAALSGTLRGNDAVISAARFATSNPANVIDAVKRSGVARYLAVGGSGGLMRPDGVRVIDAPSFPERVKPESRIGIALLELLKAEHALEWTYLSPAASIVVGERTGTFRLGGNDLLTAEDGRSWISFEDFAVALVDELEKPAHTRRRFTVGY